jgi:hypothetical protein
MLKMEQIKTLLCTSGLIDEVREGDKVWSTRRKKGKGNEC